MKNMHHHIRQLPERVVGVKFLYAKIKNYQAKKFTKEMIDNGFHTKSIFEKGEKHTKNGFTLLLVFQCPFAKHQLIEGQEVFRSLEKKEIGQYAAYGYISLKNMQGQLVRMSENEYDVKRSRTSIEVMKPLKIELKKEMVGFWDSNFWSHYIPAMSEQAIQMNEIQETLNERMLEAANTKSMVKRCLDTFYDCHYATAS